MSNSLFMDESNGNGLFAYKISPTPTSSGPSISVSNEDLSQSLSEYTDADESISAPTEILAEFLSAVMLKDYKKALKYCELILQYEPNNATAKEFFPIIQEKLKCDSSSESDENYNKSSSPEMGLDELQCANESDISNSSNGVDDDADDVDDVDDVDDGDVDDIERDADSASCMDNSASSDLSSKEEDIESDLEDATSSDLDEQNLDMVPNSGNSSSGGEGRSRSDNTTHSYSSLLLEDEDEDIVPVQLNLNKKFTSPDLDISNGNVNVKSSASCSDSESPTEPLTQRLAAILRTKCVPKKGGGGNETS